jgi:hypothetical protein
VTLKLCFLFLQSEIKPKPLSIFLNKKLHQKTIRKELRTYECKSIEKSSWHIEGAQSSFFLSYAESYQLAFLFSPIDTLQGPDSFPL